MICTDKHIVLSDETPYYLVIRSVFTLSPIVVWLHEWQPSIQKKPSVVLEETTGMGVTPASYPGDLRLQFESPACPLSICHPGF